MPLMKTVYILVTTIVNRSQYVFRTTTRDFDKRKMIELTTELDKAQTFATKREAQDVLSKCITNDRTYRIETHQVRTSLPSVQKPAYLIEDTRFR